MICDCYDEGRERTTQLIGAAYGEMFRAVAQTRVCCTRAWSHAAGACLAGLASTVAYGRMAEGQEHLSHEELTAALEDVITAARERVEQARLQLTRTEGSA